LGFMALAFLNKNTIAMNPQKLLRFVGEKLQTQLGVGTWWTWQKLS